MLSAESPAVVAEHQNTQRLTRSRSRKPTTISMNLGDRLLGLMLILCIAWRRGWRRSGLANVSILEGWASGTVLNLERDADYDPKLDAIVRTDAVRSRTRLKK
jgi:hypothetical protein